MLWWLQHSSYLHLQSVFFMDLVGFFHWKIFIVQPKLVSGGIKQDHKGWKKKEDLFSLYYPLKTELHKTVLKLTFDLLFTADMRGDNVLCNIYISNFRECFVTSPNTEKRVENMMYSGVFLNFWCVWKCDETLSWLFDKYLLNQNLNWRLNRKLKL